jgi:hypothetical protein
MRRGGSWGCDKIRQAAPSGARQRNPPPESICCFVPPSLGCYVPPSHCGQKARPPGRLNRPLPIDANSIGNPPPPSHCGQEARPPGRLNRLLPVDTISSGIRLRRQNPPPPMPDPVSRKPAVSRVGRLQVLGGGRWWLRWLEIEAMAEREPNIRFL